MVYSTLVTVSTPAWNNEVFFLVVDQILLDEVLIAAFPQRVRIIINPNILP